MMVISWPTLVNDHDPVVDHGLTMILSQGNAGDTDDQFDLNLFNKYR